MGYQTGLQYQFEGIVRNTTDEGERNANSVLIGQRSVISFYDDQIHVKTKNLELGGDELYYSINDLIIKKFIRERGALFWKYQEVEVVITLGETRGWVREYTIVVSNESIADELIEWRRNALR